MLFPRARSRRWLPSLLALVSGAVAVLAFAPVSLFPLAIVALAGFYEALRRGSPRAGFWRGWAFGVGLLGVGVSWIRISLSEFGNMDAWVADLLTALFIAAMAIYYGLVGYLTRRLERGPAPAWTGPVLLFPGLYVLLEWLRGWLFTGFPWLNLGYTQINGPLAGYAPITGVYGVSLLAALSGGLLWGLLRWSGGARVAAGAALLGIWFSGFGLGRVDWTEPAGEPFEATVVQANIPQAVKWNPDARLQTIEAYLELTRDHLGSQLIVW